MTNKGVRLMTARTNTRFREQGEETARSPRQRMLTVPGLAAEWGISPDQILRLIHAGELSAVNVALKSAGRPRYLIDRDEVDRFEARRTVRPTVRGRRARRKEPGVIKFF